LPTDILGNFVLLTSIKLPYKEDRNTSVLHERVIVGRLRFSLISTNYSLFSQIISLLTCVWNSSVSTWFFAMSSRSNEGSMGGIT